MEILELIPQRAPIIMVDRFLGIESGVSFTEFTVREDNVFLENGCMTECGLIEHMAQSAAARVGYVFRRRGEKVPLGYIGSVNNLSVTMLPVCGSILSTTISIVQEVMGITLIEAVCHTGDDLVATCRMKIFLDTDGEKE